METRHLLATDKAFAEQYWKQCENCEEKFLCLMKLELSERLADCYLYHAFEEMFNENTNKNNKTLSGN